MSIFDELREKYNRLYYPSTGEKQFETFRNLLKKDILNSEFEQARIEYQNILSNRGLNRSSIDATTGGEQQQIVTNPITGATEIITPEYNRQFRTDETDFMPGGSELFKNIYDENLGSIDPITGKVKEVENIIDTGLITQSRGEREGKDKDQGASSDITHEVINGQAYRINKVTGEVEALEGIDAMIANTLNTYVTSPFTLPGLLNQVTGNANKSYDEKMKDLKNINEDAYNSLTQQVRENYRVQQFDDEESFFDQITKGIFGDRNNKNDKQSQKQKLAADMAQRQKDREGGQGGGGEQGDPGSAGDRSKDPGGFGGFGGGADQ